MTNNSELFFNITALGKRTGITPNDYRKFVDYDSSCGVTPDGIPIFSLLNVMNRMVASYDHTNRKKKSDEDIKISEELAYENLTKIRIINQKQLGALMPKFEIARRQILFNYSFKNILTHCMKMTATSMLELTDVSVKTDNEIFLAEHYKNAVNFFETNAKHLNYERDGSHYITRTRLGDMEEIDKKLEEEMRVLKEYSKEESDYGDV